jgi:transcriptional regulator with XRE-family HTH domain
VENRIRQERAAKRLTQESLAIIVSVTRATIKNWETGATEIPMSKINTLCDFFKCTSDWLLGRTEERNGQKSA